MNQLRGLVSQLQAQVESLRGPSLDIQSPNSKRPRRREDFIPHCDEEMQEWMECRRQDLQAAVAAGQLPEVVRISQIVTQAAQESTAVDPRSVHICTPFCSGQHGDQPGEVTGLQFRSRSRYGLRGARVGEASHPGSSTPLSSGGRAESEERWTTS